MGVSKHRKKKTKDIPKTKKVENLQQKCEKERKLSRENKFNISDSDNTLTNLFKTEEQHELRKILKTNNLTSMPLLLGAVILGKFDIVKKLIKQGYDVNSTVFEKSTSLMWAVKTKNLEMIDLLVSRGADVTSTDDAGENIIFTALNSNEWDENCFLDFWQSVKKMNKINLEFANKTGNKILHFAVKRQWSVLIESLIEDKVNINSCNNKGVSALTMAAARNDIKLVNILLNAGSNVFQEDLKGNTPICYTIVNIVRKNLIPPWETYNRLTRNFTREKFEQYIDRRLFLLVSPPNNDLNSYFPNINKITAALISFVMREIPNGADILIKLQAFEKLKSAIEICVDVDNFEYLQSLLSILSLLLRWCDCCTKTKNFVLEHELCDKFIQSEIADILLFVLSVYRGTNSMKQLLPNIFLPLFLTCSQSLVAKIWLRDNLDHLEEFYEQYLDICLVNFNIKEDEHHIQIIKDKIKAFRQTFDELKAEILENKEIQTSSTTTENEENLKPNEEKFEPAAQHGRKHAKRMRRKARALKARIDKIRSADVVERIRIHTRNKSNSTICINDNNTNENIAKEEYENPTEENSDLNIKDDKEIIEIKLNHPVDSSSSESVVAQAVVLNNAAFVNNFVTSSDSNDSGVLTQENSGLYEGTVKLFDDREMEKRKAEFGSALTKLKIMLNDIICKYKFLWALDANLGHPQFRGGQGDNIHPLLEGTREEQLEKLKPLLPFIEQQYLLKLVDNFNKIIEKITHLFLQNNETYKILVEQLKHILTEHEIRGEKCLKNDFNREYDEPYDEEVIPGKYGAIGDHLRRRKTLKNGFNSEDDEPFDEDFVPGQFGAIGDHLRPDTPSDLQSDPQSDLEIELQNEIQKTLSNPTYMELIQNILPPKYPEPANQLSAQDILYLNEMSQINFKQSTLTQEEKEKIKKNTEDNAYHLVKTAYNVCETDNLFENWDEEFISPYMRKMIQKSKENNQRGFPILRSHFTTLTSLKQEENYAKELDKNFEKLGEIIPFCTNKEHEAKKEEPVKVSRWQSRIQSLQNILKQQMITKGGGDDSSMLIVPAPKEFVGKFTLATGGNFGRVELGFDKNGHPLIIKRISGVTFRQIYECLHSVMGVKHRHLLSYTACSLDPTSPTLLLGTPLCEYNLGEYVMMLKAQHKAPGAAAELVRQLLLGLQHLHSSKPEPIVHGNLKPSNVLVDIRGKIRLAEFGLHQTLYIRDRAPKSSLIWFARETYESYEQHRGGMLCTLATDMQVAGMLLHFTLTWGLHVFGAGADDIIHNLLAGRPKIHDVTTDAEDLISWMVVYEWSDRPSISQVLNHIFFWPESEKWRFLLTCSGLTESGAPLPDLPLSRFHCFLEIFSKRQGIVGDWISIVRKHFPDLEIALSETDVERDTPTGVLKFMRRMVQQKREEDLKDLILKGFPALPLSLFRLIENTEWLKHSAFKENFSYKNQSVSHGRNIKEPSWSGCSASFCDSWSRFALAELPASWINLRTAIIAKEPRVSAAALLSPKSDVSSVPEPSSSPAVPPNTKKFSPTYKN